MLLSIYSLYGQGPFYPKLYIKGCHFSQNYVQKRVFVQYVGMSCGSTGRVNGETRPTFTNILITSFFPRQVDGSDWLHKTPLQFIVFIGLDTKH